MEIRESEKLILVMLADIHEKLGIDTLDPDFIRKAIHAGHNWALAWKYPGLFPDREEDDPPVVREVVDFLEMWSSIEESHQALDPAAKASILDGNLMPPIFRGFDGNHETEYLGVARFIVNYLERFEEFAGRDLNSHHSVVPRYRKMLEAFRPIWEKNAGHRTMNADELKQVLA